MVMESISTRMGIGLRGTSSRMIREGEGSTTSTKGEFSSLSSTRTRLRSRRSLCRMDRFTTESRRMGRGKGQGRMCMWTIVTTMGNGMRIGSMAGGCTSIRTAPNTSGSGPLTAERELAPIITPTETDTKGTGTTITSKDRARTTTPTGTSTKGNG